MEFATQSLKKLSKRFTARPVNSPAGVSYNKFLAKIASDYNKTKRLYVITPEKAEKFLEKLGIEKFFV